MTVGNPNFPAHLAIAPSSRAILKLAVGAGIEEEEDEDAKQDIETFGIAGRTWEAAYLLTRYLTPPTVLSPTSPPIFDPPCPLFPSPSPSSLTSSTSPITTSPSSKRPRRRTILDIGSGTGFLPLSLAPHLSSSDTLILSDLPSVGPLLSSNLATAQERWARKGVFSQGMGQGGEPEVLVRSLAWGDEAQLRKLVEEEGRQPDVVLASDLVYFPFLYSGLVRTLIGLTERPRRGRGGGVGKEEEEEEVKVIFSYKTRSLAREQPFWHALGRWFTLTPVLLLSPPPAPSSPPPASSASASPPPAPTILPPPPTWTRFGASTPSPSPSSPDATDELYIFLCTRHPSTLSTFSSSSSPPSSVSSAAVDEDYHDGTDALRRLWEVSDAELMDGTGRGKGWAEGAGQFEEMLLRESLGGGDGEW